MKLYGGTITFLCVVLFALDVLQRTDACLPRLNMFGPHNNKEDAEQPYDHEAEERAEWTTSDWIEKNKHPLEVHEVTTKDGYILQLHRLPKPGHRPVLLVHGLLTSSLSWLIMGPNKSLAFLFYAQDYDVWLANTRGSRHGQNHTSLALSESDFWSFSFHEVGAFDLPAIVDHIRNESSFHQLIVVTHSEAFNAFLVLFTLHEEYNERILMLQALAPLAELHGNVRLSKEEMRRITKFVKSKIKSQSYEVFPQNELRKRCLKPNSDERKECLKLFRTIVGTSQPNARSLDPIVFGQLIHGGSLKAIEHLIQIWKSGDFVGYDYGAELNQQYYNSVEPLHYDVRRITVPLLLHFGETDALATPEGVHRIYSRLLGQSTNVMGVYRVAAEKFNHLDFISAPELRTLLNDKVLQLLSQYFAGTLRYVIE